MGQIPPRLTPVSESSSRRPEDTTTGASPSISAVLAVYNGERYIAAALESVFAQTRSPHEILVVDDGSTDGTAGVLARFNSRVQVIRQENRGVGAARNAGMAASTGKFLSFLDADDLWHPEKLAIFAQAIESRPEGALFFSDAAQIDADGRVGRFISGKPRGKGGKSDLLLRNWIIASTAVVRRSTAQEVGLFRSDFQCPAGVEDWDFFLRVAQAGPLVYVPGAWTAYRRHGSNSVGSDNPRFRDDALRVVELNGIGIAPSVQRHARAEVWFESGVRNLAALCLPEARRDFSRAMASPGIHSAMAVLLLFMSCFGKKTIEFLLKSKRALWKLWSPGWPLGKGNRWKRGWN